MPHDCTVEDVKEAYEFAWASGCKGLTIYRDGCRGEQPLTTQEDKGGKLSEYRETAITKVKPEDGPEFTGYNGRSGEGIRLIGINPAKRRGLDGGRMDLDGGHERTTVEDLPTPFKLELPDRLNAKRYRVRDKDGEKVYFTVCTMDDQPVEVFARLPLDTQDSYWNTICRLLSLAMRYNIPLDDITKQLRKSSGSVSDTPSRLARILDEYKEEEGEPEVDSAPILGDYTVKLFSKKIAEDFWGDQNACPECHFQMEPGGGCMHCPACGYEKCS